MLDRLAQISFCCMSGVRPRETCRTRSPVLLLTMSTQLFFQLHAARQRLANGLSLACHGRSTQLSELRRDPHHVDWPFVDRQDAMTLMRPGANGHRGCCNYAVTAIHSSQQQSTPIAIRLLNESCDLSASMADAGESRLGRSDVQL
jgi:hypothetical protein